MRKLSHCGVAFCLGVNRQTNPSTTFFFSVTSDDDCFTYPTQKEFWLQTKNNPWQLPFEWEQRLKQFLMQFLRSSFHSSLFWPKRSIHGLALSKRFRYWHWEILRLKSWFRAIGVFNNDFLGFARSPVRPLPSGNFSGSIHNKDSDSNEKVSPNTSSRYF